MKLFTSEDNMKFYQTPELLLVLAEETDVIRTSEISYAEDGIGDEGYFDSWN